MAKRKLSTEQRSELRADLKKGRQGDESNADLLRRVADKYKITTITARWYQKSIGGTPKVKKAGKRGPGRPPGRRTGSNGSPTQFMRRIQNAQEAGKLVPRWQKLVDKESDLRRQLSKLERKLETAAQRAVQFKSRIQELVGR